MKAQTQPPQPTPRKVAVKQIDTFPDQLKRHASTIMLIVTAAVVVYFVVHYRSQASETRNAGLSSSLTIIRQMVPRLLPNELSGQAPERIVADRQQMLDQINSAISDVLQNADGDNAATLRAQAIVARGDTSWALASAPPLAAAATQPAVRLPRSRDEYLKAAETAYDEVVQGYSSQILPWTSAQFGLAAIAENRGDWTKAANVYTAITSNKTVPDSLRAVADRFLAKLPDIQTPALLGPLPAPESATLPSLIAAPADETPTTRPATTTQS